MYLENARDEIERARASPGFTTTNTFRLSSMDRRKGEIVTLVRARCKRSLAIIRFRRPGSSGSHATIVARVAHGRSERFDDLHFLTAE